MAEACMPSSPSTQSIIICLPDGSLRLYDQPNLRAADVILDFPGHVLSLTEEAHLAKLPSSHLLKRGATYFLAELRRPSRSFPAMSASTSDDSHRRITDRYRLAGLGRTPSCSSYSSDKHTNFRAEASLELELQPLPSFSPEERSPTSDLDQNSASNSSRCASDVLPPFTPRQACNCPAAAASPAEPLVQVAVRGSQRTVPSPKTPGQKPVNPILWELLELEHEQEKEASGPAGKAAARPPRAERRLSSRIRAGMRRLSSRWGASHSNKNLSFRQSQGATPEALEDPADEFDTWNSYATPHTISVIQ